MKLAKKWLALLCALALAGCSAAPASPAESESGDSAPQVQEETTDSSKTEADENTQDKTADLSDADAAFENYLEAYIIDYCQQDYSIAHHYFQDPEKNGINLSRTPVTLGDLVPTQEDRDFVAGVLKDLDNFHAEDLNETNQVILEQMKWEYSLTQRMNDPKFDYIQSIWSEMGGVPSNLVDNFAEYQLFSEADIKPLITLINDTPNYVDKALAYSKKQAELGYLRLDLDTTLDNCQKILDSQKDSPITAELDLEVDSLMLDKKKAEEYKKQIHEALDQSFFPSYQTMIDGLKALEDDIQPIEGLAAYENGAEYYTLLLEYFTGTDTPIKTINAKIFKAINSMASEYDTLWNNNPDAVEEAEDIQTDFTNVKDILPFLEEHYAKDFPQLETMDYELQALSDEQSTNGIVAYFVVPTIDSTRPYEIRYNARDYGDDPTALSLYNTLAHEGIPGHMYQNQYDRQHFTNKAQYFLDCMGLQEGYATYAGFQAQTWLDVDADALRANQIEEMYTNYLVLNIDIDINYNGMSLKEFRKNYGEGMDGLYYQLAENPGVFFSYYYGYYMIDSLKSQAQDSLGDDFDEVEFNNALLRYGSVNFELVQQSIDKYIDITKNGI